jgi:hypothetical protein
MTLWAVGLFFVFALALLRVRMAFVSYLIGTTGFVLFSYLVHTGSMRHFGQLFVLLLACAWMFDYGKTWLENSAIKVISGQAKGLSEILLEVLLALHVVYGAFAYMIDYNNNFSQSKAFVAYLQKSGLADLPLSQLQIV